MLRFGKLEQALAHQIGVAADKRDKFQARLRQLQRMGFPPGANVGRRAKTVYSTEQLFQLSFALELLQMGLSPERATSTVLTWWEQLRRALRYATRNAGPVSACFAPKDFGSLTSSRDEGGEEPIAWSSNGYFTLVPTNAAEDLAAIAQQPRLLVVSVRSILDQVTAGVESAGLVASELLGEIHAWDEKLP